MGKTRAEQAQIAKERIMDAATELFSKKDFDAVSMQEIAKAAGCTAGNIYHYFGSKEELVLHTMDSLDDKYQKFYDKLQTAPEYSNITVAEKLQLFLEEVMQIMSEGKHLTNVYIYALKNPQAGMKILSETRFVYRTYQELINQMQENGELSPEQDPKTVLQQIITLTRGIMMEWLIHGEQWDIREASRKLFDVYFKGLLAESEAETEK